MKKLILVTALGLASIATLPSYAATAAGTFNVVINLTSKCEINSTNASTGAVISNVVFAYTSFQTAAAVATGGGFNVRCTNSLPYTNSGVTDDAVNLAYTLSLSAASGTGNGTDQAFTVNGSMAAGQAGTCATATCTNTAATNKTKTLTITY